MIAQIQPDRRESSLPPLGPPRVLAYAVPAALETVPGVLPDDGAWRDGKTLVVRKMVVLPDRCAKCNAPGDSTILKQTLYWHHPALFLLLVPAFLIYLVAAAAMQQSGVVGYRLCARHRQRRLTWIAVAWGLGIAGITFIGITAAFEWKWLALVGVGMVVCSPVVGLAARTFRATRIDRHFMWLRGSAHAYLESFPPLPPRR